MNNKVVGIESVLKKLDKYLTIKINNQHYAIHIASVIEIIGMQNITSVPEFPDYAKGIINLRGLIIPLIDINIRFGFGEIPYTDRTCIIVVDVVGMNIGFIVDEVDEVVDILNNCIKIPPNLHKGDVDKYVNGVATLSDKVVLILSVDNLVDNYSINLLTEKVS